MFFVFVAAFYVSGDVVFMFVQGYLKIKGRWVFVAMNVCPFL